MNIDTTAAQQAIGAMLAAIQVRLEEATRIARAATAFLSGAATTDALSSDEPPAAHASQRDDSDSSTHRYRTIWLSDIHLGSSGCQAPVAPGGPSPG